jgi:hypothetical protein
LRAQLENAGGEGVGGTEGGGIEVKDLLVGACVKGGMDIYKLWSVLVGGSKRGFSECLVPPSGE